MEYSNQFEEYTFFNNFLIFIFVLMPFMKHFPKIVVDEKTPYYKVIERKINQYTNWNLFMIFCHNFFNIHNIYLSKFIAFNSLQVCLIFHMFMIYDKRILFNMLDQTKPVVLNLSQKYNKYLIYTEYLIMNFIGHIVPVFLYKHYLFQPLPYGNQQNMGIYVVLFKFVWSLNVFGNFDVTSIYVPEFNYCSIKFFNMLIIFDYSMGMFLDMYNHINS